MTSSKERLQQAMKLANYNPVCLPAVPSFSSVPIVPLGPLVHSVPSVPPVCYVPVISSGPIVQCYPSLPSAVHVGLLGPSVTDYVPIYVVPQSRPQPKLCANIDQGWPTHYSQPTCPVVYSYNDCQLF